MYTLCICYVHTPLIYKKLTMKEVSGEIEKTGPAVFPTTLRLPAQTREQIADIQKVRGYGTLTTVIAEAVKLLHDKI